MGDSKAVRVVFDTNVLIDSARDDFSAPAQLLEAVIDGKIEAVGTYATIREYRNILRRLGRTDLVEQFLEAVREVTPAEADVQIDDEEDKKFIAAAIGGDADVIVTSDRHLLDIGEVGSIKMMGPTEVWADFSDDSSSEWQSWAKGLGIGNSNES